jgi:hypothetical protein
MEQLPRDLHGTRPFAPTLLRLAEITIVPCASNHDTTIDTTPSLETPGRLVIPTRNIFPNDHALINISNERSYSSDHGSHVIYETHQFSLPPPVSVAWLGFASALAWFHGCMVAWFGIVSLALDCETRICRVIHPCVCREM